MSLNFSPASIIESPLKRFSKNNPNSLNNSNSFQSPLLPKRLFLIDSTNQNQNQIDNLINLQQSTKKLISSSNLQNTSSPKTPVSSSPVQFTPIKKSVLGSPSTNKLNYEQHITPNNPSPLTPFRQSSKIPLSLNPQFNSAGIKLGRKRLLERIRINLISLVIVWILTSTRFYNKIIIWISSQFPILAIPLRVIEWLFLAVIVGNLMEGYYKLKTQVPITHVELPLTPQQIRGGLQASKNTKTAGIFSPDSATKSNLSPFQRSQNFSSSTNIREQKMNQLGNKVENSSTRINDDPFYHDEVLSKDPMINPLKSSTNHLFKRSIFNNENLNSSTTQSETNYLRHSFPSRFTRPLNSSSTHPPFNLSPIFQNHQPQSTLTRSVRKVSNRDSLHKLLEETLAC